MDHVQLNPKPFYQGENLSNVFLNALAHNMLQPVIISRNPSCTQDSVNIWILRLKTTIKLSQVDACINGILLLKLFNKLQQQQDGKFAILRGIMSCYSMQSSHCCHTVTNNSFSFKFNNRKQRSHCLNDTSLFCHKR